ncbi:glycosyl transferase group 1 [Gloeothece citriformis PCC 7424]|uniref:Glycosyl transferase group 1 n=1 Tax=Gloeothece citriformis (strain PCC 7424) TaxID=65393 RepID=B7K803_GLOC7|nr:glycosyltransferase family 1 protein [Gloeothece citriformis]ACK68491.1 glycosyl transferase group 1 [Gloeothece citriformis PCC 7424]
MLNILIDGTALRPKPSGIGLYVYHLINGLEKLQTEENFNLSVSYQPSVKNWLKGDLSIPEKLQNYSQVHCLPIPVTLSNFLAKYPNPSLAYFEKFLGSPTIVHGPDHVVYPCRNSLKVMTITDLTFIKYPQFVNSIVKTYTERVKQCLKWTDLVITISQSSKQDIIDYLGVKPDKVYVTPLASRYSFQEVTEEQDKPLKPYLLFVSTLEPRKNVKTLILAFNLLKQTYKIEHRLILIGQKGWKYQPIFETLENSPWKHEIDHLDYVSDEKVAWFYRHADVFVYPSIYEGFGLPVLEAMTLGTPVVTSNTSSIPEVTGDAALLVDPNDPHQLAEAIFQIISDHNFRQTLIRKGQERAKLFSWEKTARETFKAYCSLLK